MGANLVENRRILGTNADPDTTTNAGAKDGIHINLDTTVRATDGIHTNPDPDTNAKKIKPDEQYNPANGIGNPGVAHAQGYVRWVARLTAQ